MNKKAPIKAGLVICQPTINNKEFVLNLIALFDEITSENDVIGIPLFLINFNEFICEQKKIPFMEPKEVKDFNKRIKNYTDEYLNNLEKTIDKLDLIIIVSDCRDTNIKNNVIKLLDYILKKGNIWILSLGGLATETINEYFFKINQKYLKDSFELIKCSKEDVYEIAIEESSYLYKIFNANEAKVYGYHDWHIPRNSLADVFKISAENKNDKYIEAFEGVFPNNVKIICTIFGGEFLFKTNKIMFNNNDIKIDNEVFNNFFDLIRSEKC